MPAAVYPHYKDGIMTEFENPLAKWEELGEEAFAKAWGGGLDELIPAGGSPTNRSTPAGSPKAEAPSNNSVGAAAGNATESGQSQETSPDEAKASNSDPPTLGDDIGHNSAPPERKEKKSDSPCSDPASNAQIIII
jgi:hypothetical protein